jgi:hypothetical protein
MALYIFGIGGTGARVIKALTMLLASGVQMPNAREVVPILIDPDSTNGDLSRTLDLLRLYQDLRKHTEQDVNGFFHSEIKSLSETDGGGQANFHFPLDGASSGRFKELIDLAGMDRASQAMTRLLFSNQNLDSDMQVGFKGNPNIGSVVLNRFKDTSVYKEFARSFNDGDRIMIVGSIFGGTGASGLPLLLKNLRDADPSLPKHQLLRDAPIAAISVQPYFDVQGDKGSSIDSNTFVSKTRAALEYYADNICRNQSLNALYYLADDVANTQKGADGAAAQRNKAHFIELAAAMAVFHFMGQEGEVLRVNNGRAQSPTYLEYGLRNETHEISFEHFGPESYNLAARNLTQFFLFQKFYREYYFETPPQMSWIRNGSEKLNPDALDPRLKADLERFNQYFDEWLAEMEQSTVHFRPFQRDASAKDLLNSVEGFKEQTPWYNKLKGVRGQYAFHQELCRQEAKLRPLGSSDRKLFGLFYATTKELAEQGIKL